MAAAVASPEFRNVIEKTGVIPISSSVDEFAAIIADTAKEAAALAQAWRPHRSLAVLHLWTHHAIDPPR